MAPTQKSQKKRPASSQAGPTPKKIHLEKSLKASGKEKVDSKKRSRPVTLPVQHDSPSEDDDLGDDVGDDGLEIGEDDVEMDVDGGASMSMVKDPNGASMLLVHSIFTV